MFGTSFCPEDSQSQPGVAGLGLSSNTNFCFKDKYYLEIFHLLPVYLLQL
jgi:hypothetical protein